MQFLEGYYPGYVMGHEDHRDEGEIKHEPHTIHEETRRIVEELYAEDIRLWELVKNGSAYYPPNYRNCTAKLPDGSRAGPPTGAKARGRRGTAERSLQPHGADGP